jgi:hypothetical protein
MRLLIINSFTQDKVADARGLSLSGRLAGMLLKKYVFIPVIYQLKYLIDQISGLPPPMSGPLFAGNSHARTCMTGNDYTAGFLRKRFSSTRLQGSEEIKEYHCLGHAFLSFY